MVAIHQFALYVSSLPTSFHTSPLKPASIDWRKVHRRKVDHTQDTSHQMSLGHDTASRHVALPNNQNPSARTRSSSGAR